MMSGEDRLASIGRWGRRIYWNAFVLWHARRERSLPYWPLRRTLALQSRRVRRIVAHAQRTVPFYREFMNREGFDSREFETAEDLKRLPVVEREQLAEEPQRFTSEAFADGETVTCLSTGSCGFNRSIRYDHAAAFLSLACGHRSRLVDGRFTDRSWRQRQVIYGSSLSSAVRLRSLYEQLSWIPKRVDFQRTHAAAAGALEGHAERLRRVRPHLVGGYGVYLGSLFRQLHESGLEFHRPALVLFWGEAMPETDRRFIEEELGIPVRGSYTATEALRLGWECERRNGYHVDLDLVAIRVVDAGGNDLDAGRPGELLISNLTNRATVLLNYRLGDVVTQATAPCPCGRTLPLLSRIDGRTDDLVRHPDGSTMHVWAVLAGVESTPGVVQNQLVQDSGHRYLLRLVLGCDADREPALARAESELRAVLGPAADITVEQVDALTPGPGGKVRLVVEASTIQLRD